MDWQQFQGHSPLRIDDDFSWSEPPRRRRRLVSDEPIRARRLSGTRSAWDEPLAAGGGYASAPADEPVAEEPQPLARDEWTEYEERFDRRRQRRTHSSRIFDLSDPGAEAVAAGSRRAAVSYGRGEGRYVPATRRRAEGLRFHERAGLRPDRAGLWAVLLGVALVVGAVAH